MSQWNVENPYIQSTMVSKAAPSMMWMGKFQRCPERSIGSREPMGKLSSWVTEGIFVLMILDLSIILIIYIYMDYTYGLYIWIV